MPAVDQPERFRRFADEIRTGQRYTLRENQVLLTMLEDLDL